MYSVKELHKCLLRYSVAGFQIHVVGFHTTPTPQPYCSHFSALATYTTAPPHQITTQTTSILPGYGGREDGVGWL